MKTILNLLDFYKVENYIDMFELIGFYETNDEYSLIKIKKEDLIFNLLGWYSSLAMVCMFVLFILTPNSILLLEVAILLLGFSAFIYPALTLEKKIKKNFGKIIEEDGFKEFLTDYFSTIRKKDLSKKETIEFLKNWKENLLILKKEEKITYIENLNRNIKSSEEGIKNMKERIKISKEKLKELK